MTSRLIRFLGPLAGLLWLQAAQAASPAVPPINAAPATSEAQIDAAQIAAAEKTLQRAQAQCQHHPVPARSACLQSATAPLLHAKQTTRHTTSARH